MRHIIILALCLPTALRAGDVLLSSSEITAIASLVTANTFPWTQGHDKLILNADTALDVPLQSVTYQGATSQTLITMNPYDWSNNMPSPCGSTYCDGEKNPLADNADSDAFELLRKSVIELALAYRFSANTAYADKAVALIKNWCTNATTKMLPTVPSGTAPQEMLVTSLRCPSLFYGGSLLLGYGGWNATDKADFLTWSQDLIDAMHARGPRQDGASRNNWEQWRLLMLSSGAALVDDSTMLAYVSSKVQEDLPFVLNSSGAMVHELTRTKSLFYSMYALTPFLFTYEVLRRNGTDIYSYTSGGKNIKLALDYHAPYIVSPSTWPYPQSPAYDGFGKGIYELAYAQFEAGDYLTVLGSVSRPIIEWTVASWITLTHAWRDDPTPTACEPPVMSPAGGGYSSAQSVTMTTGTSGATIYFTTDGTTPDATDMAYSAAVSVSTTSTLKALSIKSGLLDSTVTFESYEIDAIVANNTWQTVALPQTITGAFSYRWDYLPNQENMDCVFGLSNGVADDWTDLACIVRMSTGGTIDARNGSTYASTNPVAYEAGVNYVVEMWGDIGTKKYSASVRQRGGRAVLLASHFDFRTEQAAITQFTHIATRSTSGTATIRDNTVGLPSRTASGGAP